MLNCIIYVQKNSKNGQKSPYLDSRFCIKNLADKFWNFPGEFQDFQIKHFSIYWVQYEALQWIKLLYYYYSIMKLAWFNHNTKKCFITRLVWRFNLFLFVFCLGREFCLGKQRKKVAWKHKRYYFLFCFFVLFFFNFFKVFVLKKQKRVILVFLHVFSLFSLGREFFSTKH